MLPVTPIEAVKGTRDHTVRLRQALQPINPALLVVAASLALSLIGVYSIDVAESVQTTGRLSGGALKQLVFTFIGLGAAGLFALPHYRYLRYVATLLMAASLALLVFLLIPAVPESIVKPRNGARGWINLGVTDFQPSEVAKIAYVLVVAHWLRFRKEHRSFKGLLAVGLITLPPVALITLQPDLGTSSLFIPSLFAMLVAAGAKIRHMVLIIVLATAAAPAMYPVLKDHQKTRIVALLKQIQGDRSSADDINFQSFTAQTMVGAGGVSGNTDEHARALLHYNKLPERHNDMIFAVIVNRFGLFGGLAVMGVYLVWIAGALLTAAACREPFGRIICVGLTGFVAAQMLVNIGMTVGLLPIIGITLPFVSYGGSSMLTSWLMTGLIFNVGLHRARPPFRPSFEYGQAD